MNEILFFIHVFLAMSFILLALRLGKEYLIGWISLQGVLANLLVLKQVTLFGCTVTCSDVYMIGAILGLNLLQEFYGRTLAKKVIWINFYTLLVFLTFSQLHLLYLPSPHDFAHASYWKLFNSTPRIVFSSVFVYLFTQLFDSRLYAFLRSRFQGERLPLRNMLSLSISQFVDTLLFSFLGLYGIVESIFDIIVVSFFIKVIVISSAAPFVNFAKKVFKQPARAS